MTRSKDAKNCTNYHWHVTGTIAGQVVNKKYCSITGDFLGEWGGDATPMNLNKSKVLRLKKKWHNGVKLSGYPDPSDPIFATNWVVSFRRIQERVQRSQLEK